MFDRVARPYIDLGHRPQLGDYSGTAPGQVCGAPLRHLRMPAVQVSKDLNPNLSSQTALFENVFGLLCDIKVSVICPIQWMNQSLVAVGCLFKFTYVHGKDRYVGEHFV